MLQGEDNAMCWEGEAPAEPRCAIILSQKASRRSCGGLRVMRFLYADLDWVCYRPP